MIDNSYSRGLIKYTSRDYNSIMADFWAIVPTLTDLWHPDVDSDPGVVLGKLLASAADMLSVNLDWLANELFAPTVSQRKNAEKLFRLIGYELGWYTAARTEVTFKNSSSEDALLDFGFNGTNFSTLNAYTDITGQSRVITYNVLPHTSKYNKYETRSNRDVVSDTLDVFSTSDRVVLRSGETVTRVAIEGELRSQTVSVKDIKDNNYIIKLPSQHIDTTAVWIKTVYSDENASDGIQWIQCSSVAEFTQPEPRFAVTYDQYSNAQIQISNYLKQLENFNDNHLIVYWIDCSGVIGCVGQDVLSNWLPAWPDRQMNASENIVISNLTNTVEAPHTHTVTGRSPETAKEAYYNSRNYINTWDSLVTLPDFNRFLNREPGVDCGLVLDCQKALDINLEIYHDPSLSKAQKSKMYITNQDFPAGNISAKCKELLKSVYDPTEDMHNETQLFATNFKQYTAMCFAVHNDFLDSPHGEGHKYQATVSKGVKFIRYKPPEQFIDDIKRDYHPVRAMSVDLEFGFLRVFTFYVVGQIYLKHPVDSSGASDVLNKVKETLQLYFAPANRHIGSKPTVTEIVDVIEKADSRISYFDAGSLKNTIIKWYNCDIEYFNPISFARYIEPTNPSDKLIIAPQSLL